MKTIDRLVVSTPGRVCLFGEHQDYLHLPVVACAISLRMSVAGKRRPEPCVHIALPDIDAEESFLLGGALEYVRERDYYRSVVNVLLKHGFSFSGGLDCVVHGEIPISAGTSSSSALVVAWTDFLAQMSDQHLKLSPMELARYAYEAEVIEFAEPGGMMDQCAAAWGGIIAIDFYPTLGVEKIDVELESFVLGDSGEPKDTRTILARVRNQVVDASKRLSAKHQLFSLHDATIESIGEFRRELSSEQYELLVGTLRNRHNTVEGRKLLKQTPLGHRQLGNLLNEHHAVLRDVLKISTPKIDAMLEAALNAGAYGGKINGSGGGGCMLAYVPEKRETIAEAIESAGGKAYIVRPDTGARNEQMVEAG